MFRPKLDTDLIRNLAPSVPSTNHHNHENCPAGEDRKQRLYITLRYDGTILAYCHNCGSRGYWRDKQFTSNIHAETYLNDKVSKILNWNDGVAQWGMREEHDYYLSRYSLDVRTADRDDWRYGTDYKDRPFILTPVMHSDMLIGKQHKFVDDKQPKALWYGSKSPHLFNPNDMEHVVVCEDRISAARLVQDAPVASLCLHGSTPLSLEQAHALTAMFTYVTIWYDMDNDTVIESARASYDAVKCFIEPRKVHLVENKLAMPPKHLIKIDPKNFPPDTLRNELSWPTSPY